MLGRSLSVLVFDIEGMHCEHCSGAVEKAIRQLRGVKKAEVSLTESSATVWADESKVSAKDIIDAVISAGFGAKLK